MNPFTAVPAHDLEAEASMLGVMMMFPEIAAEAGNTLNTEDFYSEANRVIFEAIQEISNQGNAPGTETVRALLTTKGEIDRIGGHQQLYEMVARRWGRREWGGLADILVELSAQRQCAHIMRDALASIHEGGNASGIAAETVDRLGRIGAGGRPGATAEQAMDALDDYSANPIPAVPTGLSKLDGAMGGYTKGSTNLIAGWSGGGKTSLLARCAVSACLAGRPVLFQSLEMTKAEIGMKLVTALSNVRPHGQVPLFGLVHRSLTKSQRRAQQLLMDEIRKWPLRVDDNREPSIAHVTGLARSMQNDYGEIGVWLLENIQLWKPFPGRNRQEEVAEASNHLKRLAGVFDTAIVIAGQLNEDNKHRSDKRPARSDLRDSLAPFHDASTAVFIYRPSDHEKVDDPGEVELWVRKQRFGPCDFPVKVWFDETTASFVDKPVGVATGDRVPVPVGGGEVDWLARATEAAAVPSMGDDGSTPTEF